jgi:cytochrome c
MRVSMVYLLFSSALLGAILMLGACSNSEDSSRGLSLIEASGCQTCHKMEGALIGPSYAEVAQRYKGADAAVVEQLTKSILNGGSGNWGSVPMTPHPHIAAEDAALMVRYILSL